MNDDKQTVFISYAWGGESEEIVNEIDTSLQKRGIKIVRDKRDLGYKGSIHKFMEQLGQGNCVIVVISDKYLRSSNCMFELMEIADGKQFIDRIFPIVLTDATIYDPLQRIKYVKYWEDKREKLAEEMKTLDPANLQGIREDLDLYDRIRDKISSLASILKDMNTLTPDILKDSDFSDLYNAIETRMRGDVNGSAISGNTYYHQTRTPNGQRVDVAPPFDQPPYSMRLTPIKDLPRDFPFLVDRTKEVEFITAAIQTSIPVVIFGEQGIGKTSLVRRLIHRSELPSFANGTLYVDSTGYHLDDLLQFVFNRFFISPPELKLRDDVIREALQKPNALILLDNFQLRQDETISLLNAVPRCTFIFSSIEQSLSGEGKIIFLKGLPEKDAVTLFENELARFVNVNHSLSGEEQAAAMKLCALYQGHPKRIIDAAHQVAQGIKSIFQLLEESQRDDPEKVLLQTALSKLTESQESVLALLTAVGGSKLPLEHLVPLSQDPDITTTLQGLISLGLIQVHNLSYSLTGNPASSLAALEDLSVWEDRLLDHFTHWLEEKPAQARIEESTETILYLLKKASEKQKWSRVVRFGRALEPSLIVGKRWQAWAELLNQILGAAKALGDRKVEAWVLHQLGSRAMCLGQDDQARELLTEALNIRKEIDDKGGLQVTQHNLDVLLRIPVPPDIPREPSPPNFPPFRGWITGGLAAGIGIFVAAVFLLATWFQAPPPATATPTVTDTFTPTASSTPTRTPTPSLTPTTPTNTPTPSSTPTNTSSPTPVPSPIFISSYATHCRAGPGPSYQIFTSLSDRDPVLIVGRTADGRWLRVYWEKWKFSCWVDGGTGEMKGNLAEVPVMIAPTITPLPTNSPPPTPLPTSSPSPTPLPTGTPTPVDTECPPDVCVIGI